VSRKSEHWASRLPFYYGWVIVGVAFVTMAIGVTARTSFSLLLPPVIDEFGWDRGRVAGAFSFGFLVSAIASPIAGRVMDHRGPRVVIETGVCLMIVGLWFAQTIESLWQLYLTLGVMVGAGANLMSFTAQSLYLPNWFARRRGLAISIAFAGVGAGAILLLPWLQTIIARDGWRASCKTVALLALLIVGPLNFLVWHRPENIGLSPDGISNGPVEDAREKSNIVDAHWASIEWTLARAMRTGRFWLIMIAYFCALFAWYAVQVHQTKYLTEVGFSSLEAAWALGAVSAAAIPGQIGLGALSDRVGREWIWSAGCFGFTVCYASLILMEHRSSSVLLYVMIVSQGSIGYALTSVMGPIVAEIFEGPHYGAIFGAITVALIGGGAAGPWVAGVIHDADATYRPAFQLAILCCIASTIAIWLAAPRNVRLVPGRKPRSTGG
jgi:MFS family permease